MLKTVRLENFRSVESCEVQLGPLNVFYGPTGAGKSSLFYALVALRSFASNPNQAVDAFFNLGFQNLGGFDACVFNHETKRVIGIDAEFLVSGSDSAARYGVRLGKLESQITLEVGGVATHSGKFPLPYALNQAWPIELKGLTDEYVVSWNGITSTVSPKNPTAETQSLAAGMAVMLNAPAESLKAIDICPSRRGFFKPFYSASPLTPIPTSEDEVATIIINDPYLAPKISQDTDDIFDRDFRVQTTPATTTTYFYATERHARTPSLLVNDGFGVNQVVYMLSKMHRPEIDTILIEEPEVHLHPSVIRKFARAACRIAKEEGKQLLFTTHSADFLIFLLACVKDGTLAPHDLCCYHVERDKKRTEFHRQEVSSNGQVEGGLSSFVRAELEDLKNFLGA